MAAFTFKHGDRPLEGYVIQRGVGRGGFGEVYFALSDGGREVALKYLRDNPAIELRGVSHCMNLKSPHLVTIFDVRKNDQGEYFVIMEYVQGPSLRDLLIAEPNGLGAQKASFFLRELAKGLGYLHDRGIVHRDMKPGNIFYEDGYVKIGDYGLSKFISVSRHSAQTASVGTVHYMAPEVGSGSYHRGIDIYALGVMLYEMLLGRVPYDGSSMGEVLMKHLTAQPAVDELPAPFPDVIRKALAKDPKDRYQTVDEMAQDVLAVEHVQESLAGFNPRSLTVAARGALDRADSPLPSPNPLPATMAYNPRPGPSGHLEYERLGEVSPKLARRIERVGAKIDRKLEKLGHRFGRQPATPLGELTPEQRRRRWFMGLLVILGFAILMGVAAGVIGPGRGKEEAVASGIMGVLAMVGGVMGARKAQGALGNTAQPRWVKALVTLGCSAPLIAISMIPAVEGPFHPGLILGLIAAAVFVDWEKRIQQGAGGEMKFGEAFSAGLGALIFTAIATQGDGDKGMFLFSAGIAAAASLAVQGLAWFVPPRGVRATTHRRARASAAAMPCAPGHVPAEHAGGRDDRFTGAAVAIRPGRPLTDLEPGSSNVGVAFGRGGGPSAPGVCGPRQRLGITRAFWSVACFALLAGVVVSSLSSGLLDSMSISDRHAALCIGVICFAMSIFAARKVGLHKRPTFWRETLRPLLQSAALVGIGVPIVCLAVLGHASKPERDRVAVTYEAPAPPAPEADDPEFNNFELRMREYEAAISLRLACADRIHHALNDEQYVAAISVLVISSLLFMVLLFARGRRPVPANFLLPGSARMPATGDAGAMMAESAEAARV